jgi:hypothetical protein
MESLFTSSLHTQSDFVQNEAKILTIWIPDLICKLLYILAISQSGDLKVLYSLVKPLYILATCLYECFDCVFKR